MERRDEILEALRAGEPVSGEDLARRLGISRAAVGKHVSALRDAGYSIEATHGAGYRLVAAPDAPLPAEVRRHLLDAAWPSLTGGGPTGSTSDDAKALARAGAPDGTVVLASAQSAGRGRLGRSWVSPSGGVYLTAVLRPRLALAQAAPLALVVALGVARGLERLGVRPGLKWPNDLVADGRKLAGVLVEVSAEADRLEWAVAGVGINVHRPEAADPGVAFADDLAGARLPLAEVGAAAIDGIGDTLRDFSHGDFAALREAFLERSTLEEREVTVRDLQDRVIAEGLVRDVDADGRLVVGTLDGVQRVSAGDVTLRSLPA